MKSLDISYKDSEGPRLHRPSSFDSAHLEIDEDVLQAEMESDRASGSRSPRRHGNKGRSLFSNWSPTSSNASDDGNHIAGTRRGARSPLILPGTDPMAYIGGAVVVAGNTVLGSGEGGSPLRSKSVMSPRSHGAPISSTGPSSAEMQHSKTPRLKVRATTKRLFEPREVPPEALADASVEFQRVVISGSKDSYSEEAKSVGEKLMRAMALRDKYLIPIPEENWGGLDPEMYRDFMSAKGIRMRDAAWSRGRNRKPEAKTEHARIGTDEQVASGARKAPSPKDTGINNQKEQARKGTPKTEAGIKMMRQNSTDRLRRRMDVPFDPYAGDINDVPATLSEASFVCEDGVFSAVLRELVSSELNDKASDASPKRRVASMPPTVQEFYSDFDELLKISADGPVRSFCFARLKLLEMRFRAHVQLNREAERDASACVPHRDFYNVRKVDTHIHHSACMNAKHLLRFIKHKLRFCPDEIVIHRDGEFLTLSEVFHSLNLTAYDLSVDTLDMHAHFDTFHRFDRFNLKYNPCGQSRLREIFLKYNNLIKGRYLADITKEVFSDVEKSKYQLMEPRISIYGRNRAEWTTLGSWTYDNQVTSKHVRWMVQVPRLYSIYKKIGLVDSFQDMLDNIFLPLFEVTRDPSSDPKLHWYLKHLVAFDCVDDESKPEPRLSNYPKPSDWTIPENPPYSYWLYYLWANLRALNAFRAERGLNVFAFRPHAGEAGAVSHLGSAFLLCHHINHGVNLRRSPVLQYLYYLKQVGIAMSPLSNNRLFLTYDKNPFQKYFNRGLNVSLSTDDPLQLHHTKDALLEEYSVALQVYGLSSADLCELARNSVLQSGFEHPFKIHFLGRNYTRPGPAGNDIHLTNVPNQRVLFRHEALMGELDLVRNMSSEKSYA